MTLRHSKTDQDGAGQVIAVPHGKVLKPVVRLKAWLAVRGAEPGSLFWQVDPQGRVVQEAMSDRSVARLVQRYAAKVGLGAVHAINERIAAAWRHSRGAPPTVPWRAAITIALLVLCMVVADRVGLIALIANGYRALAFVLLALYILPLLTIGLWRFRNGQFASGESR